MWFLEWGWEGRNHSVPTLGASSAVGTRREGDESCGELGALPPI